MNSEQKTLFSEDRVYRFTLWRDWSNQMVSGALLGGQQFGYPDKFVQFVGLNPSTADETIDDPTIRRCIGFSKSWGYGALCMTNLFAFRATFPGDMKKSPNPIGTGNTELLESIARSAGLIICAWGAHGTFNHRDTDVISVLKDSGVKLMCLGKNSDGTPKHPLYIKKTTKPTPL